MVYTLAFERGVFTAVRFLRKAHIQRDYYRAPGGRFGIWRRPKIVGKADSLVLIKVLEV